MAITPVGTTEASFEAGFGSSQVPFPAQAAAGDVALLFVDASGVGVDIGTPTTGDPNTSGTAWTLVPGGSVVAGAVSVEVYSRVLSSADITVGNVVVDVRFPNATTTTKRVLTLMVRRGVDAAATVHAASAVSQPDTQAHVTPVVQATVEGCSLIEHVVDRGTPPSSKITVPTSKTPRSETYQTTGGSLASVTADFADPVGLGPRGGATYTGTIVANASAAVTLLLKPAAAGGSAPATIALRGSTLAQADFGTDVTAQIPPATVAGDTILVWYDVGGAGPSVEPPADFAPLAAAAVSNANDGTVNLWSRVYGKTAAAADAGRSISVTQPGTGAKRQLHILVYEGATVPAAAAVVSRVETSATVSHATPTVAVSAVGSWSVQHAVDRGSPGSTSLSIVGATQRLTFAMAAGGASITATTADSSGAVTLANAGGNNAVGTISTNNAVTWTLVLSPATVAGGGEATFPDWPRVPAKAREGAMTAFEEIVARAYNPTALAWQPVGDAAPSPTTAPTVRAASATDGGSTGSNAPSITLPAGIQNGDRGIVVLAYASGQSPTDTPAGWSAETAQVSGSVLHVMTYRKTLTTADSSTAVTVNLPVSPAWAMGYIVVAGASGTNASTSVDPVTTDSTTMTIPSITPTVDHTLLVEVAGTRFADTAATSTASVSAPWTERADALSDRGAGVADVGVWIATRTLGASTANVATGTANATLTASGRAGQRLFALAP